MEVEDEQKCERKRNQTMDGEGQKEEEEAAPIKCRYIISVHMHEVDRSIHPSVSQSKAIDERTQPGGSEPMGKGEKRGTN